MKLQKSRVLKYVFNFAYFCC